MDSHPSWRPKAIDLLKQCAVASATDPAAPTPDPDIEPVAAPASLAFSKSKQPTIRSDPNGSSYRRAF